MKFSKGLLVIQSLNNRNNNIFKIKSNKENNQIYKRIKQFPKHINFKLSFVYFYYRTKKYLILIYYNG